MASHYIVSLLVLNAAVFMLNVRRSSYDERKAIQSDSDISISVYFSVLLRWCILVNGSILNRHLLLTIPVHQSVQVCHLSFLLYFQSSIMQQTAGCCGNLDVFLPLDWNIWQNAIHKLQLITHGFVADGENWLSEWSSYVLLSDNVQCTLS